MTPHHAFPDVSWPDLRSEISRELEHRKATLPKMVGEGLSQAEADRQITMFAAILEDVVRFRQSRAPIAEGKPAINPLKVERSHRFSWHERRRAIALELDYRRRTYPRMVENARLTADAARRRIHCLECMRALYELGYDWRPESGAWPHWSTTTPAQQEHAAREEWMAIESEIAARSGVAQQEMAL
ncbi:hypothetical protein [Novosphingobium guangzhouense]|uniref:hypothetical protein n=1 Tax=Novosphingobium guangzhouense TaxID=1850347 RepID=UPI0011AEDEF7|nr:hypothetical protein [Novosphingobium guangzhouense]